MIEPHEIEENPAWYLALELSKIYDVVDTGKLVEDLMYVAREYYLDVSLLAAAWYDGDQEIVIDQLPPEVKLLLGETPL